MEKKGTAEEFIGIFVDLWRMDGPNGDGSF
jgi:hypothetical protein